jgi:hypothetical protein
MKYYIARKRHFYGNIRENFTLGYPPTPYLSRKEAVRAIMDEENDVYRTAHNESGRPTLKVISENQLTLGMQLEIRYS